MKILVLIVFLLCIAVEAQVAPRQVGVERDVLLQPLALQVSRLGNALKFLGQPLSDEKKRQLAEAIGNGDESAAARGIEAALDPLVLAVVDINAESRVKVQHGAAEPELVQGGARFFLVKVLNRAHITSRLVVDSKNSLPIFVRSNGSPTPPVELTATDVRDRWAEISIYGKPPMEERLSGVGLEYLILEVYSRDSGQRAAEISFNVGQGSQDIGFRNDILVVFHALPSHTIKLHVLDENYQPTMASFTIRDQHGRLYPNPSKRLAPDFFFQPQIYRVDGETIDLPPGRYTMEVGSGPEYFVQSREIDVTADAPRELSFQLERWIDPSRYGWYSGDHHIHAAGCSHYQNPTEGVLPKDMGRQIEGEKLNIGAVLNWGPSYYYQKQFFSGQDDPVSRRNELLHYDLEVSGFPSSQSGHLVLLGLKDQNYPGTKKIEDWPTWDLPVLQWAHQQGAVTGFAHSGWGLEVSDHEVPSFELPAFDSIGANEYIVDVTHPGIVDFISAGDTPYVWELSIWYHILNVGFRTRIAGETDFPCITDERVGQGRSYVKVEGPLTYSKWIAGIRSGRSYVSTGQAHLMDFSVNDVSVGVGNSEVRLSGPGTVHASVRVAALLGLEPNLKVEKSPYGGGVVQDLEGRPSAVLWDIERARVGNTRKVQVELVVNDRVAQSKLIMADGSLQDVSFDVPVTQSSWMAFRILPAAHTNPIFIVVNERQICTSSASAQWALDAVRQCWSQKERQISLDERPTARSAYDRAEQVYEQLKEECALAK